MSDPGVGSELGACAQESHFGLEVCPRHIRAVSSEVTWSGGQRPLDWWSRRWI